MMTCAMELFKQCMCAHRMRVAVALVLSVFLLNACGSSGSNSDASATDSSADGVTANSESANGDTDSASGTSTSTSVTDGDTVGVDTNGVDATASDTTGSDAAEVGSTAGNTAGNDTGEVDTSGGTADGNTTEGVAADTAGDSNTDETNTDGNDSGHSSTDSAADTTAGDTSVGSDGSSDGSSASTTAGNTEGSTTSAPDPTPIVRAPADAQILISDTLTLNGSVAFPSTPLDIPVIQWSALSGPGNVVFSNAQSANSSAEFDDDGMYELELRVANGPYEAADTLIVVVTDVVVNQAPQANAGADESLTVNDVLNLSAEASDDGLPNDTLTSQWRKVAGMGEVSFGETSALTTTATFSATGDYELEFYVTDGELDASDRLSVNVTAAPVENSGNNVNAQNDWQNVTTSNGSKPQARHEAAAVAFQNQLYLLGGRGTRQVNRYNPANNRWENLGTPGLELSHFQPVVYGNKIYILGSLDCCFPSESVIAAIQIFDPATKQWSQGASLPANRLRGSAGTVVYNNKIYMIGGSTNGHDGGMVKWFDEYNPATNTWKTLADAPNARDHFSAAMVGNKLVAAGGRRTDHPATFANLVTAVDIYNFGTGRWESGARIPTQRAGAMTVSYGDEVILIGGESDSGVPALRTVEAYNVKTDSWRALKSLKTARHSGGAAIVGGAIHVVSGNTTTGGGNETQSHEKLDLD